MSEHFVFLRSYRKVIELMFFFTFVQTPVRCPILYLKRGESLTYGTRESLTCGIGETLIPFEVVSGAEMGCLKASERDRVVVILGLFSL